MENQIESDNNGDNNSDDDELQLSSSFRDFDSSSEEFDANFSSQMMLNASMVDHELTDESVIEDLNRKIQDEKPAQRFRPIGVVFEPETVEENPEHQEIIRQGMRAPSLEDDDDIFGPVIEVKQDPACVREVFLTKGFVSASKVQGIRDKVKDLDDMLTEDVHEIIQEAEQNEVINHSITTLSQTLNSGFLERVLNSQILTQSTSHEHIDEDDMKKVKFVSSMNDIGFDYSILQDEDDDDIEEVKCTEDLESSFMNCTNFDYHKKVYETEDLEKSFIHSTQFETEHFLPTPPKPKPQKFTGFAFASGRSANLQQDKLEKLRKKFQSEEADEIDVSKDEFVEVEKPPLISSTVGFSFASGKSVTLKNKSSLKKFEEKFAMEDEKFESGNANNLPEIEPAKVAKKFSGFAFASGKSVEISESRMEKLKSSFFDHDREIDGEIHKENFSFKTPVAAPKPEFRHRKTPNTSNTPETSRKISTSNFVCDSNKRNFGGGFASASGGSWKISQTSLVKSLKTFEKINEEFDEDESLKVPEVEAVPPLKKVRLDFGNSPKPSTPFLKSFSKGIAQHSTPLVPKPKRNCEVDNRTKLEIDSILNDSSITIENFVSTSPKREKNVKIKLEEKFNLSCESDNESQIVEILNRYSMISSEVRNQREIASANQLKEVNEKADYERKAMAGSVFMQKSLKGRMKVRNYVENAKPMKLNRHQINFENALDFKFSLENYPELTSVTSPLSDVIEIVLGDNAKLIPDRGNFVGLQQIKSAFLSSLGVDPNLIRKGWIENSYKFLVLKFSQLENSFEKFRKFEILTPSNVLLQLKYRYDREIDRNHRSAIRKIVELDDIPCRRMIFRIERIHRLPQNQIQLDVSDGWYAIRTLIDETLENAVNCGKIYVGMKIITACAELTENNQGHDPLNLPDDVKLKIHGNSTRRVAWHEKLGFCRNPYPIRVSLSSITTGGGIVGCLNISVVHVYDVVYVDKKCEQKEFINRRVYEKLQKQLENQRINIYEAIAHKVEEEEMKSLKLRVKSIKQSKKSIEDLTPDEVFDLIKSSEYVEDIMSKISKDVKNSLENIKMERKQIFEDEVRKRIGDSTQGFTRVLRFRVVDSEKPTKTALISWWSPTDDLIDLIKVGRQYEIFKIPSVAIRDEINLTAGNSSVIKVLKSSSDDNLQKFSDFYRKLTKIEELKNEKFDPPNQEFDLICMVIKIEDEDKALKMQKILVADESFNFIFISFWTNIASQGFGNVIKEGEILYVKNLQWRKNHLQNLKFTQVFTQQESSNFITNSKNINIQDQIESFKQSLGEQSDYWKKCLKCLNINGKENVEENSEKTPTVSKPKQSQRQQHSRSVPEALFDFGVTPKTSSSNKRRLFNMSTVTPPPTAVQTPKSRPNLRSSQKSVKSQHKELSALRKKRRKF